MPKTSLIKKHGSAARNPDWADFDLRAHGKHVHDWRGYVTPHVRNNWNLYSLSTKCAIVDICQSMADSEEWD